MKDIWRKQEINPQIGIPNSVVVEIKPNSAFFSLLQQKQREPSVDYIYAK
jgi:hypothetical protein